MINEVSVKSPESPPSGPRLAFDGGDIGARDRLGRIVAALVGVPFIPDPILETAQSGHDPMSLDTDGQSELVLHGVRETLRRVDNAVRFAGGYVLGLGAPGFLALWRELCLPEDGPMAEAMKSATGQLARIGARPVMIATENPEEVERLESAAESLGIAMAANGISFRPGGDDELAEARRLRSMLGEAARA